MRKVEIVSIEICRKGIKLPEYKNVNDAGMDIEAAENITIYPEETVIIPTGLKVAIPEGYEIQIRPRSGLSLKTPLRISNSPGTIDTGYRDEIGVIISNTSAKIYSHRYLEDVALETYNLNEKGNKKGIYKICKGDRIAQLVLKEVPKIEWDIVDDVKSIGFNRQGGFGSTGV